MTKFPIVLKGYHYCVSRLDFYQNNEFQGYATGFFYKTKSKVYLVTCKHNLKNEPNEIRFKVHTSRTTNIENREINITLFDENDNKNWVEHQQKDVDIIGIDINSYIEESDHFTFWERNSLASQRTRIEIGEPCFLLGYPKGFYDKYHNLPVGPSGTLASAYGAWFNSNPYFLINANTRKGVSGAPVIIYNKQPIRPSDRNTRSSMLLLGIFAGEFESIENGTKLGLHRVYYSSFIPEMFRE